MANKKVITKDGLEKLKDELKERTTTIRREIADKLDDAKSMGDLSENSAYHAALEEYQFNEARIKDLKGQLQTLEVAPDKKGDSSVDIGDSVSIQDVEEGTELTYTLVGEGEGNPADSQVSVNSVFGKALVGKKEGEEFSVTLPSGEKKYKVTKVT